jgi:hypothetical protein
VEVEFAKSAGAKSGSTRSMTTAMSPSSSASNPQNAPSSEQDPQKKAPEGEQDGQGEGRQGLEEEGSWRDGEVSPDQGAELERPDDVMVRCPDAGMCKACVCACVHVCMCACVCMRVIC